MVQSGLKNGTQQLAISIATSKAFQAKNRGVSSGVSQVMKTGVRNGRLETQMVQLGVKTGVNVIAMDTHGMKAGERTTKIHKL
jgi:uncharacterized oligopeptide transporter (OPT) family protein